MRDDKGDILIIDDTLQNLQLLVQLLSRHGYAVRPAKNGVAGIRAARKRLPDLILLDINMPDMDGYTVCEQLKADDTLSSIPVLFISAYRETFDKVRAFEVGGVDYISKPFEAEEVLARIRTHLRLRRQQIQIEAMAERRIAELHKMAELQQEFFSATVHDLKNPLGLIIGSTYLIGETVTEAQRPNIERIENAVSFMNRMITNMLDLARVEAELQIEKEEVLLGPFLQRVMRRHLLSEKHIEMRLSLPEDDVIVSVAPLWLERALVNLLSNAIKFTPDGGDVAVVATVHEYTFTIAVTDTGRGIPADDTARIFERFYRVSQNGAEQVPGTGLGLSIVKAIVDAHSGEIDVESEVGVGTTFTMTLPIDG